VFIASSNQLVVSTRERHVFVSTEKGLEIRAFSAAYFELVVQMVRKSGRTS